MSASTAADSPAYIMGGTSEEYTRLKRQAQVWEPMTRSVLERASIAPGMRCLDAGCGPGEVMRLMAGYVGSSGRVVGLDADAAIGAEALAALHGAGFAQCSFRQVDLTVTEHVDEAPFDLVFARLLLFHLRNPAKVLRRLYSWVKPGGRIVIQDYDTTAVGHRAYP